MGEWGWVAAGYAITATSLLGYGGALLWRARRARRRAGAIAARRGSR